MKKYFQIVLKKSQRTCVGFEIPGRLPRRLWTFQKNVDHKIKLTNTIFSSEQVKT